MTKMTETGFWLSLFALIPDTAVASWQCRAGAWGEWCQLTVMGKMALAGAASNPANTLLLSAVLPWKPIKHALIGYLTLFNLAFGEGCRPAQTDGADVRRNRKPPSPPAPVSESDEADSSVNTHSFLQECTCSPELMLCLGSSVLFINQYLHCHPQTIWAVGGGGGLWTVFSGPLWPEF